MHRLSAEAAFLGVAASPAAPYVRAWARFFRPATKPAKARPPRPRPMRPTPPASHPPLVSPLPSDGEVLRLGAIGEASPEAKLLQRSPARSEDGAGVGDPAGVSSACPEAAVGPAWPGAATVPESAAAGASTAGSETARGLGLATATVPPCVAGAWDAGDTDCGRLCAAVGWPGAGCDDGAAVTWKATAGLLAPGWTATMK